MICAEPRATFELWGSITSPHHLDIPIGVSAPVCASKVGELAAWGDADCVAVPRRLPRRGMISCQIARPVQEPEKRAADRRLQREELGNVPGSRRVDGCSREQ